MVTLAGGALPSPDSQPPIPLTATDCYLETRPLAELVVLHPRLMDTPEADAELLESLKLNKQLAAIDIASDGTVLNGSRRKRIMPLAGFTHALCRVHPGIVTDEQKQKAIHAFDVQQKRSLLERGLKYDAHIAATGCSQDEAAAFFGCAPCDVTRGLRLARCSPQTRAEVATGQLNANHLHAVSKVKDDARREELLRQAAGVNPGDRPRLTAEQLAKLASGKAKRKAATGKTHTERHGRVTVTWERSLTLPELKAELDEFFKVIAGRVRQFDPKATPVTAVMGRAVIL